MLCFLITVKKRCSCQAIILASYLNQVLSAIIVSLSILLCLQISGLTRHFTLRSMSYITLMPRFLSVMGLLLLKPLILFRLMEHLQEWTSFILLTVLMYTWLSQLLEIIPLLISHMVFISNSQVFLRHQLIRMIQVLIMIQL